MTRARAFVAPELVPKTERHFLKFDGWLFLPQVALTAKFGDSVRSKTERAQINEALCKVLCHNICCLIQSMYELGLKPKFWAECAT